MRSLPKRLLTIVAMGFVLLLAAGGFAETQIYVSDGDGDDSNAGTYAAPLKTIAAAKAKVRTLIAAANGPVNVYIREGKYYLDTTLIFTNQDGGTAATPVTYSAFRGEKVVISGAKVITPDFTTHSGNIKVADIGTNLKFDQLFVNGDPEVMARYPNFHKDSVFNGYDKNCLARSRVATWKNVTDGPGFLRGMHERRWGAVSHIIVGKESDGDAKLEWVKDNNRGGKIHQIYRMVENIFEELDAPREWFYNKKSGKLYYYPPAGLNLATALFETPVLDELIIIKGTSSSMPVKYLTFKNLVFTHTHRTLFTRKFEPLLLGDWCVVRSGVFLMKNTERITIKGCTIEKTGGNGIFMSGYNNRNHVYNNRFIDNGASCVQTVGDTIAVRNPSFWFDFETLKSTVWNYSGKSGSRYKPFACDTTPGPKTEDYPRDILIENNYMYNLGRYEKQTCGINMSMASRIIVRHNTIDISPRSGIAVNDGTWGGHIIEYNDIRNCVLETSDHGPFNGWGRDRYWTYGGTTQGGSNSETGRATSMAVKPYVLLDAIETIIIRNNRWYQPPNPEFRTMGVDLDDGCTNYEIYNNLCLNCPIKLREGFYRKVYNNIMINRAFEMHVWFWGAKDTVMKNIIVADHNSTAIYRNLSASVRNDSAYFDSSVYWANGRKLTSSNSGLSRIFQADQDKHSIIGTEDPMFMDTANGDFRVKPGSPALKLGFVNFPMDSFGLFKLPPDTAQPLRTAVLQPPVLGTGTAPSIAWQGGHLTVRYELAAAGPVDVDLFSMDGRRVASLFTGVKGAGSRTVKWSRNEGGLGTLAPNTYLVAVKAGGYTAMKRIVLVR